MTYKPRFVSVVFFGLFMAATITHAAPLTEQQLIKLKAAGIGQDLIIQQIQNDGIAFSADAEAMIVLKRAGFSDAVLSALLLLKGQAGQVAAPSQSNASEKQPPAQAQVDPCVARQQEYERLDKEDDAITTACEQIGKGRNDLTFIMHCQAMNCSTRRRMMSLPNPNKCPTDYVVLDSCDDAGYIPDPNLVYRTVEILQSNDSKYSCAQLKVSTSVLHENVAQMDKYIQHLTGQAQNHSQMAQAANVLGGAGAPAAIAGMQMMSSSDSQKAGNLQQVRDSQQKRHDYLMQIYFQKQCND